MSLNNSQLKQTYGLLRCRVRWCAPAIRGAEYTRLTSLSMRAEAGRPWPFLAKNQQTCGSQGLVPFVETRDSVEGYVRGSWSTP